MHFQVWYSRNPIPQPTTIFLGAQELDVDQLLPSRLARFGHQRISTTWDSSPTANLTGLIMRVIKRVLVRAEVSRPPILRRHMPADSNLRMPPVLQCVVEATENL
jgi:hypothetical protein